MYIYIFEDGTTQRHESGPTAEDFAAIADGLLMVLYSYAEIVCVDEKNRFLSLTECEFIDEQTSNCHAPA